MKVIKLSLALLLFAVLNLTWADEITLQNGNEYDGCEDSYVYKSNYSSGSENENHGSSEELKVKWESC